MNDKKEHQGIQVKAAENELATVSVRASFSTGTT